MQSGELRVQIFAMCSVLNCTAAQVIGAVRSDLLIHSPVKKTLNKRVSVNISGTNWKSLGCSRAMHFQCVPLNFMCPMV